MTQSQLKSQLHYNPDTGIFTRLNKNHKSRCGYTNKLGYIEIGINYKKYKAHRLAWLYIYGHFPNEIDHINHTRDDNRICNLRDVNKSENQRNRSNCT